MNWLQIQCRDQEPIAWTQRVSLSCHILKAISWSIKQQAFSADRAHGLGSLLSRLGEMYFAIFEVPLHPATGLVLTLKSLLVNLRDLNKSYIISEKSPEGKKCRMTLFEWRRQPSWFWMSFKAGSSCFHWDRLKIQLTASSESVRILKKRDQSRLTNKRWRMRWERLGTHSLRTT